MQRDRGPNYNIGFGVNSRYDVPWREDDQRGPDTSAGMISKALNGHPIMRFFAISAATAVSAGVAGALIHGGGKKVLANLGIALENEGAQGWKAVVNQDLRRTRAFFDTYEGVTRGFRDEFDDAGQIILDEATGQPKQVPTSATLQGFFFKHGEQEREAALGGATRAAGAIGDPVGDNIREPVSNWSWRDELQQRMVRQARRLPYELPGAYVSQRLILDPLFGMNREKAKPNWYNPVDVLGDFAQQSVKNLAAYLLPLDAGAGIARQGWRKAMTYGSSTVINTPFQGDIQNVAQFVHTTMNLVGTDIGNFLYQASKSTDQVASSLGAGIRNTLQQTKPLMQLLHEARSGAGGKWRNLATQEGAKTLWSGGGDYAGITEFKNAKLGPLSSPIPFVEGFRNKWFAVEEHYAHREALLAGSNTVDLSDRALKYLRGVRATQGLPIGDDDIRSLDLSKAFIPGGGRSTVENLASSLNALGRGGPDSQAWRKSDLHTGMMRTEYKRRLENTLVNEFGIDPTAAKRFTQTAAVLNVPFKGAKSDVMRRIGFGNTDIAAEDATEWMTELKKRAGGIAPVVPAHGRSIYDVLPEAVTKADSIFMRDKISIDLKAKQTWEHLYRDVAPAYAADTLQHEPLPYERFGAHMGDESYEYLLKRTAEVMGLNTTNIGPQELRSQLIKMGFNPKNQFQLRAFLVEKGEIAKPWQTLGFNALGLRHLTVQEGLDKGYFGPTKARIAAAQRSGNLAEGAIPESLAAQEYKQTTIADIMRGINRKSPYGRNFSQVSVGSGAYITQAGKIIDLSPLATLGNRMLSGFSRSFKIPLLNFNPLKILGYGVNESMAEANPIQYIPGMTRHPGLKGVPDDVDALFWLKSRKAIGKVVGLKSPLGTGATEAFQGEGLYKPFPTDDFSLAGKYARIAYGDKGQYPGKPREGWRKLFNLDENQPGSIPERIKRIGINLRERTLGRSDDISNPIVFAKKLLEDPNFFESHPDKQALLDAWQGLEARLRATSFGPRVLRGLEKSGLIHGSTQGGIALDDIDTLEGLFDFQRSLLRENENYVAGSKDTVPDFGRNLHKAESLLIWRHLSKESVPGYFEGATGTTMAKAGIARRQDALKADIYKMLMVREGLSSTPAEFGTYVSDLFGELDKLKAAKAISQAEYIEGRAAILSTQLNLLDIKNFGKAQSTFGQAKMVAEQVLTDRSLRDLKSALRDVAEGDLGNYGGIVGKTARRLYRRNFSVSAEAYAGTEFNPYSHGQEHLLVPTFGTTFARNPRRALASSLGFTTWSDPEHFSSKGLIPSHLVGRLNRYFSNFSMGLDETSFKGPLDLYARGMVGKRVLPVVAAGTAALTVDRTLGGFVFPKDQAGHRVYRPLLLSAPAALIAHGQMAMAGIVPGGQDYQEKKEELLNGNVAIRKGRWWPLGNTPWKGGKIQYFRPSWYRRFKNASLYTDDTFGSPLERAAFGYDFSPLRPLNPYWFERKHYTDRPYPVSGEYFTGPWGPLTGALNATIGRIIKPSQRFHEQEVKEKLGEYQTVGQSGVFQPVYSDYYNQRGMIGHRKRKGGATYAEDLPILGTPSSPFSSGPPSKFDTDDFSGGLVSGGAGTTDRANAELVSGVGSGFGTSSQRTSSSGMTSRRSLKTVNNMYAAAGAGGSLPVRTLSHSDYIPSIYGVSDRGNGRGDITVGNRGIMPPRVLPGREPISQNSNKFQFSQLGYEVQEMAGIYGFAFGSMRQALGLGSQDLTPKDPVLLSAGRAYGSERGFWDLNLGGVGDVPGIGESEYSQMELSEIVRRFIPHRRRDANEINPITNDLGIKHPWLPGRDYFVNFKEGDPYASIADGEMRLPGQAYERLNPLHPDATGRYGLVDKYKILADTAQWSPEFRALDKQITQLHDTGGISDADYETVLESKRELRAKNKKIEFHPYVYENQDYKQTKATITGQVAPGVYQTSAFSQPVRLAGVRVRKTDEAAQASRGILSKGDKVVITTDSNRPPNSYDPYVDAIIHKGDQNVNQVFMKTYGFTPMDDDDDTVNQDFYKNPDAAYAARTRKPIDILATTSESAFGAHRILERLAHRNTLFNDKFFPYRSAVEDWERENVYGATFPQWQNPYESFIKPMIFKATTRNPITSALVMGAIGRAFGANASAKAAGQFVGATTGFIAGSIRGSESFVTGKRFIPRTRKRELAVEEYTDVLTYVRNLRLFNEAMSQGDTESAKQYRDAMQRTMYGVDLQGQAWKWESAIPKRKKAHFRAMLDAPKNERGRILSTAGRLERRMYEQAWGMKVEKRPSLTEYFQEHELPDAGWEGWNPNVSMDQVKIKVLQSLGLDASQMGYYPQQIQQANLVNPSYPSFAKKSSRFSTMAQLQNLLSAQGVAGNVREINTPYPGTRVRINAGIEN